MSNPEYLTAKRTVDDRALNVHVFDAFHDELAERAIDDSVSVLEIGAGTGTMIARLAERDILPSHTRYRAVDRDPEHIAAAKIHLPTWLEAAGYTVEDANGGLIATRTDRRIDIRLEVADAFSIDARSDVCIAMAVLDLVDLPIALEQLAAHLESGGILYAPLTFDGQTAFAPTHPADTEIERAYHHHMAEIRDSGGPRAGRQLLDAVPTVGGEVIAVGGSAQVIHPQHGAYPAREETVLSHILETIGDAVREVADGDLTQETIDTWLTHRRTQLDRAHLSYVASNLDVLARL